MCHKWHLNGVIHQEPPVRKLVFPHIQPSQCLVLLVNVLLSRQQSLPETTGPNRRLHEAHAPTAKLHTKKGWGSYFPIYVLLVQSPLVNDIIFIKELQLNMRTTKRFGDFRRERRNVRKTED